MAGFLNCFTATGSDLTAPEGYCTDYDGDGDADLEDFVAFVARFRDSLSFPMACEYDRIALRRGNMRRRTLSGLVLVIVMGLPAVSLAQDPNCPGSGSCCVGHGGPGCDDIICCDNVCFADFFCCFVWDSDCANLAETLCGSHCAGSCPSTGDCCTPHSGGGCGNELCCDLVCLHTPACCESGWTAACADLANQICDECKKEPTFVCPQPGECCVESFFTKGCEREGCCETVCRIDDYCCNTEWDSVCANLAHNHCLNVCDCEEFGNFDEVEANDLRDAAAFQNCFSGSGSAPVPGACACADFDGDGDADLLDFAVFSTFFE
jgi:hypothetical protein